MIEAICDKCNKKIKSGSKIFICPDCLKITCEECVEKEEK